MAKDKPNIGEITGGALNALPIEKMIGGPALAVIATQVQTCKEYVEFVRNVGLDKANKAILVDFEIEEEQLDGEGNITGSVTKRMRVPLLALVTHPNIGVEKATVDFEMTIETSESSSSMTEGNASLSAQAGWGPFSVKITGKVAHKSEQTRKTDTRAKYSFHVEMSRLPAPEGMQRVLDYMIDTTTRPARKLDSQSDDTTGGTAGGI